MAIQVIKDWTIKRRIAYDPTKKMTIDERDDDWCLEYLRFTRSEIKEIAYVLQIPSSFRYGIKYTAYNAHALVLFRLSAPLRLKDAVERFNRDLGWISTVFSDRCSFFFHHYRLLSNRTLVVKYRWYIVGGIIA